MALGFVVFSAREWADPWRLGRGWRWLPWGLVAVTVASWAGSVVPRAGVAGVTMLPAFVLAPSVFARWLAQPGRRRWELLGLAAGVFAVAAWSLVWFGIEGTPRPARPLGHHNLLAFFLVTLLPVVAVMAMEREAGKGSWARRGMAGGALLAGTAATVMSRSLSGLLALGVAAGIALLFGGLSARGRRWGWLSLAALGLLAGLLQGGRVLDILRGEDLSARARGVYLDAGLRGLGAAPWLGHGPGSTAWTIAAFWQPVPGVTPPGEVLGELHSWPLAVVYELGLVGLGGVLLAFGVFFVRRARDLEGNALGVAGLAGLAAALVMGLGTAEWRVTALPLVLTVAMAAALAGGRRASADLHVGRSLPFALVWALLALAVLTPKLRALFASERWLTTGEGSALAEAARLDPDFPLYRARVAWERGDAEAALAAARSAAAVPALWAGAAELGVASGAAWAREAALTARALDPLLSVGPWLALVAEPGAPDAPGLAAHALAAEPRLGAALFWRDHPELLAAAVGVLERDSGLDAGWRLRAVSQLAAGPREGEPTARLGLGFDDDPARSVSLVSFRRRARPHLLAAVPVGVTTADRLAASLPSAALRPASSTQVLVAPRGPREAPQELWKTLRKSP